MPTPRQTKQDGEDTKLILYRLDVVEGAVKDVSTKLDHLDNIKRSDLTEFRDTLVGRMTDMQANFQRQLDDKADADAVDDLKKLMGAAGGFFLTVIGSLIVFYLTNRK